MGKKKSKKISDSAYLKLQEMITDGLDSVLESMNEVLKNYPYPEKKAGRKKSLQLFLSKKIKTKTKRKRRRTNSL